MCNSWTHWTFSPIYKSMFESFRYTSAMHLKKAALPIEKQVLS